MTTSLDFMTNVPLPSIASSGTTTAVLPKKKPIVPQVQGPMAPSLSTPSGMASPAAPVISATPSIRPAIPEVKAPTMIGGVSTKPGLSTGQISSIQVLSMKPASQWTDIDKKNWAYATNGAAMPGASPAPTPAVPAQPMAAAPSPVNPPPAPTRPTTAAYTQTAQANQTGATTGATPAVPSAVSDAEKAYQDSLKISPEELSTQADLDRLTESAKKAYTNAENQAIPLQFITGQLAAIERRANTLAEPLSTKLARMQAQRQSSMSASKFALERADKQEAEARAKDAEREKAIEVNGNIVKLNPETGKYETVYQAPAEAAEGFTLGEGQKRYDAQGNLIAEGAEKPRDVRESGGYLWERQPNGSWGVVGGTGPADGGGKVVNVNGTDYIRNADGTFSLPNIPNVPVSREKLDAASNKITLIDNLLSSKGLTGSVGSYGVSRWTPFSADKAERQDFAAGVLQLISKETLDTLIGIKARGATLGALSDTELNILKESASKINTWMQTDDNGKPTGKFEISEALFKAELNRMKEAAQKVINYARQESGQVGGGIDESDPEVRFLREQGATDEEIRQIRGFNTDPGTSVNGLDAKKVTAAIGQFESGGNYKAVGPVTQSGDRAYGKYQIMGANIPSWSKEVLGRSISVQDFINNPKLQDAIAQAKIGQYLAQYGTIEDVASMWFSGRPLKKAGNAKDIIGTSVPQYAKNVRAIHDRMA